MRIDKFLKVSRIIKRRTVAAAACSGGRVFINGKQAKPGSEVSVGDVLEIGFGEKLIKVEILKITEHVLKDDAADMYKILEG